ncbi:NAD(P)-binding protein [Aspergillus japonicus CBS 114.51]|nr:NAD(P)-binding protein [Aspergillus japonicus CBS 114.51]RAH81754.1 NAD(P)-binding protein [Aspergillus japonicus CBS 114.51]
MRMQIITIFGATGNQGSSVARSLLRNRSFEVRCITRNAESKKAQLLKAQGAVIVEADGYDTSQIQQAFSGSWGAFVNTNGDDPSLASENRTDRDLGLSIIRGAAAAGVKHLVYSSGPWAAKLSGGACSVPSNDAKAEVQHVAQGLGFETVTPIMPGWFFETFLEPQMAAIFGGFPVTPDEEGWLTCRAPLWGGREHVPFLSVDNDFGDIVHGVFLNPVRWNLRPIQAISDFLSFADFVNTYVSLTGKKARFVALSSPMEMETMGHPLLESIRGFFIFSQLRDGEYFGTGPTEKETATALKQAAHRAQANDRKGEQAALTSARDFLQARFGNSK